MRAISRIGFRSWKAESISAGFGWIFFDRTNNTESYHQATSQNVRSPLMAEAMALSFAQQHAIDLGYKKIKFASDSQVLIKALNSEHQPKELHGILHDILSLSLDFDDFSFVHVNRDLNRRADEMN